MDNVVELEHVMRILIWEIWIYLHKNFIDITIYLILKFEGSLLFVSVGEDCPGICKSN